MVLRDGHTRRGSRVWSRLRIFRAPQPKRVCSRRIRATTSAAVSRGEDRGARLWSCKPATPRAR